MEREKNWGKIPSEDKELYIRLLRTDGHSDNAIGKFFGTTKNAVVGFRYSHLPELTSGAKATKSTVDPARFEELLAEQQSVPKKAGKPRGIRKQPRGELPSPSVARMPTCEWPLANGNACGKPCVKNSRLCEAHLAYVRNPKLVM